MESSLEKLMIKLTFVSTGVGVEARRKDYFFGRKGRLHL